MEVIIMFGTPRWRVEELTGYKPLTTFWEDFSIADRFGAGAVRGTFRRAFNEWKHDYKYLTELVMVLNHKIWQFHQQGKADMAELYDSLWRKADGYAVEHLKGEELQYFAKVID